MILRLLGPGVALLLGACVAGALLLFAPLDRALVLDVFLVYAGAVVLQALVRATRLGARPPGSSFEAALRRPRSVAGRPDALLRLESLVALAPATAGDFHVGLRPRLRDAAAHRLRTRRGVELDAEPERAARVLGAEAWELLRPDRARPEERFDPGPSLAELERTVAAIERIS